MAQSETQGRNAHQASQSTFSQAEALEEKLLLAIDTKDANAIKALIKKGGKRLLKSKKELNPLGHIIAFDNDFALKVLLEEGIKPDAVFAFEAVYAYADKSLKLLLEADKSYLKACNGMGRTLLMEAITQEHEKLTTLLLEKGARADLKGKDGETALTLASLSNNSRLMRLLFSFYPDLDANVVASDGETPLMRSVVSNNLEQVEMLLEAGALVNIPNQEGVTALDMAFKRNYHRIARLLTRAEAEQFEEMLEAGHQEETLESRVLALTKEAFKAISNRNCETLQSILEKGISPNSTDETGTSLLFKSIYRNDVDLVDVLLNMGADVNLQDSIGQTPLLAASRWGFEEITARLLSEPNINTGAKPLKEVVGVKITHQGIKLNGFCKERE